MFRQKIHRLLEDRFKDKGGSNFYSLNGSDIMYTFSLYNKFVFGGRLTKRFTTRCFSRRRSSGDVSICGVVQLHEYYIDIAPVILASLPLKIDRIQKLQLIIERQLVSLILLSLDKKDVRLYNCVYRKYFGTITKIHASISVDPERPLAYSSPIGRFGSMVNQENSCYLDSLLAVLFLGEPSFYRKAIFDGNVQHKLQKRLFKDYHRLIDKEIFHCSKLRALLLEYLPDMKINGIWCIYNASAVYSTLVDIFSLKIRRVPVVVHLPRTPPSKETKDFSLFQFWDYLGSNAREGEEILWDLIKSPILVFQNGGLPPITEFGISGQEGDYFKVRSFGKSIIQGRYNLFGVVMLHGTRPGKDGGSHYTAYIKTKGGQWYNYDDIGPIFTKCILGDVFSETNGSKPEIYFYQKTPFFLF